MVRFSSVSEFFKVPYIILTNSPGLNVKSNVVRLEVGLSIRMEIKNLSRHLITSLFVSQMLTGNNSEECIEFPKKYGCCRPKRGPGHDLTKIFTKIYIYIYFFDKFLF